MENKQIFMLMPQEQVESLVEEVKGLKALIVGKSKEDASNQWLESEQARKMLGVSAKTWQLWRDNRKLPFVQFGRKIWVKRADIDAFLESNYVCARG